TPGLVGNDQTICEGTTPEDLQNIELAKGGTREIAGDADPILYVWETSPDNNTNKNLWTEIGEWNPTNTSFTFTEPLTEDIYVRRKAAGGPDQCDTAWSEAIHIAVVTPPVAEIIDPVSVVSPDTNSNTFNEPILPIEATPVDAGYVG